MGRVKAFMDNFKRFAVYYAPPEGAFGTFCNHWLGWDAAAGAPVAHPEIDGMSLPIAEITETPRKYGFHGTVKPPFKLTGTADALLADLRGLCTRLAPVACDGLELAQLGRFLAFTVLGDTAELANLAAEVVKGLDPHRAPASQAERDRRRANGLTPRQEELLETWGYPYVMDEFKFHLTMSGRLTKTEARAVKDVLTPHVAPLLPAPFVISDLCLFGEAEDGRFHLITRVPLTG